jgi:anaerobic ribonucleoside-triphosphate reductase activating protein
LRATGGVPLLNVAATCRATGALGPGRRAVLWVQGCPFRCRGCLAPDWIPDQPSRFVTPDALVDELLADPAVTGLTFSGGEPMMQAAGLAQVARRARGTRRDLSVICFTGFALERLRTRQPGPGVAELLEETDVLIDGQYVADRDDNRGLRGSDNQRIHHLTDRLRQTEYDFANRPRSAEIHVDAAGVLLVGVPPAGALRAFRSVVGRAEGGGR